MDIIDWIEQQVELLGWVFSYGNSSNQNLLVSDRVEGQIYFLLDPVEESEGVSQFGGTVDRTFSSSFMLLVKSDLDEVYHNQKGVDKEEGKYNKNIKPLKTQLNLFKEVIDCSDYIRESWKTIDTINALDLNGDGLIVTFTLSITQD